MQCLAFLIMLPVCTQSQALKKEHRDYLGINRDLLTEAYIYEGIL